MNGLKKAIDLAGGQAALARKINVKQGHIWYWLNKSRLPAEYVAPMVAALDNQITPHELRPDIFPAAA